MKPIILKKTKMLICAIVALILFGIRPGYATKYYVATTGNNNYTTAQAQNLATPWKTIQKAANTLVAGDTVYIRVGTYKEQITPKNSGNASKYIIYTTYPGETVIVDGASLTFTWAGMFEIQNRSYILISGFRVINSPAFGIHVSNSNNIKILNNYTYNTRNSGVRMGDSDTITVDGNEIEFASNGGNQNNGIQECLSFHKTPNSVASNNIIHNCGMESIDFKVASSNCRIFGNNIYNSARIGIYVDGYSQSIDNVEIYNNIVHDSKPVASGSGEDGIRIGAELGVAVSNVKIYNNIIYNISMSGISVNGYTEAGYPKPVYSNFNIYNNTVYNIGTKVGNPWGGVGIGVEGSANTGIVVRNNILSKAGNSNISVSSGGTISNNLFDGGSASGTSAVKGNPLFVNAAANDFHLQLTSPAINAGFAVGAPATDFDGILRTGNPDIGAYEYFISTGAAIKKKLIFLFQFIQIL
jgi:parallel beta-helix repeat protein